MSEIGGNMPLCSRRVGLILQLIVGLDWIGLDGLDGLDSRIALDGLFE